MLYKHLRLAMKDLHSSSMSDPYIAFPKIQTKILCSLHPRVFNVKEIYAVHKCDIIILSYMQTAKPQNLEKTLAYIDAVVLEDKPIYSTTSKKV